MIASTLLSETSTNVRAVRRGTGRTRRGANVRLAVIGATIAVSFAGAGAAFAQAGVPQTDDEKAFYALGTSLAQYLQQFKPMSSRELDLVVQGLRDVAGDKVLAVEKNEGAQLIRTMTQKRQEKATEMESAAAASFLAAEAAKPGAVRTESGLIITHLKQGSGPSPAATDTVRVHYRGTLRDGSVFDSSIERGQPSKFPLNRVIPCWTEGVAQMKVGGKARLVCPAAIAYGNRGAGRIPPGAALAFEVELLEIVKE